MSKKQEILQAVARGWCDKKNEKKIIDPDLAISISNEVLKVINKNS